MPSIAEQLAEVYALVDSLHDIEIRLRNALDGARDTMSGERTQDDQSDQ